MNQQAWDNGVEVKRLRDENWRLRVRIRRLLASRDMWRGRYRELHRTFTRRLHEEMRR